MTKVVVATMAVHKLRLECRLALVLELVRMADIQVVGCKLVVVVGNPKKKKKKKKAILRRQRHQSAIPKRSWETMVS